MPATSTSFSPIRNTTAASTAFGMYERGTVRNRSTTTTMTPVVSCEIWLRPPALSTISVFVGLPLTTNVPESPAARLLVPSPTRSTFSSKLSSYFIAYARDVAALWARIRMNIEKTTGSNALMSSRSWSMAIAGSPMGGRPLGTEPIVVIPRAAKSNR